MSRPCAAFQGAPDAFANTETSFRNSPQTCADRLPSRTSLSRSVAISDRRSR